MARAESSKPTPARLRSAVICTPGLESVCEQEMRALGLKPKPAGPGTIEFSATPRQLYSANVWLRTASRVIVRVAQFRATDFPHLQEHAARIDWGRWVPDGHAPSFRISSNESKLYHTKAIAQRLHQVSIPPSIGEPEQGFVVRIDRNTVTISIDSSGMALHKRAWRTELGPAPLRSTMAAAMLLRSGWTPADPLLDPFCGSGTIAIEAALIARGLPPGGDRDYAFQRWSDFEPGAWASVQGTVRSAHDAAPATSRNTSGTGAAGDGPEFAPIVATDRDGSIIEAATRNADRADVGHAITFERRVVAHTRAVEGAGWVVTNPPYGKRLGRDELRGLYRRLGAVGRERLPGFGLCLLTADPALARSADRGLRPVARFRHGGLPVELFTRPPDEENAVRSAHRADGQTPDVDLTESSRLPTLDRS